MNVIHTGQALKILKTLPDQSVHCIVTSPPYWALRDYGVKGQMGLEATPDRFIRRLVKVFNECRRVLRNDGTLWINMADSYASEGKNRTKEQAGRNSTLQSLKTQEQSLVQRSKIVAGLKAKDLVGIPWSVAFALRRNGWFLRQDIIWHKPNPMPESVTDRCTKSHEYVFLFSKSKKYFYDAEAISEPVRPSTTQRMAQSVELQEGSFTPSKANGNMKAVVRKSGNKERKPGSQRGCPDNTGSNVCSHVPREGDKANKRSVWSIATVPFKEAHFATFPEELPATCIKAGCPAGGIVLDPFMGAGTTAMVARKLGRNYIGIELNPEYVKIAERRLKKELGMFQ